MNMHVHKVLQICHRLFITEVAGQNYINTGAFYYGPWHTEAPLPLDIYNMHYGYVAKIFKYFIPSPGKSTLPTLT